MLLSHCCVYEELVDLIDFLLASYCEKNKLSLSIFFVVYPTKKVEAPESNDVDAICEQHLLFILKGKRKLEEEMQLN